VKAFSHQLLFWDLLAGVSSSGQTVVVWFINVLDRRGT
jgi:hypothetical protein